MRIKLILAVVATFITMKGMEKKASTLEEMLLKPSSSLKFLAAMRVAQSGIRLTRKELPEELLELVNKLKKIYRLKSGGLKAAEKKLLLNLFNNPNIDIEKASPQLIRYLKENQPISKKNILNSILSAALNQYKYAFIKDLRTNDDYLFRAQLTIELGADRLATLKAIPF